ncbi:META domain-containing protein [Nitriliruptor alkaliphilus]|uniref:META domain-containing protein n=1 Tax=Nitriliruptor alkaliphilus TaxID=427918 RepID=UPI00069902F2|nr:META domain-containing protein [Nitriliruptor alkaliphilus]
MPVVPRLVPWLVGALALTACGQGTGAGGGATADPSGEWTLVSGTGPGGEVEVGDGVEVTLGIDEDRWGGAVCNSYGANSVEVGDGTVTITDVDRTEMACLDEALMRAEDAYLAAFVAVEAFEVTGDELRLTGDGVELVYEPVAAEPTAALVGTIWVLDTLIEGTGPDGSASSTFGDEEATLELRDDGSILASSGCLERDDGSYEVDGDRLRTSFANDDDYDCGSEQAWAQDTHVWDVLGDDPTFEVVGQRLTLTAGDLATSYRAEDAGGPAASG